MKENRIKSFHERYSKLNTRFELIRLETDVMDYMNTEEYNNLSDNEKETLDDLLMDILSKKEHFQVGCDPWKNILGEI